MQYFYKPHTTVCRLFNHAVSLLYINMHTVICKDRNGKQSQPLYVLLW